MYSKCRGLVLAELLGKHTSQNNISFMRESTISKDSFVHPSVIKVSSRLNKKCILHVDAESTSQTMSGKKFR